MMKRILFLALSCLVAAGTVNAAQNVPQLINYSGQLADATGQPVSGQLSIRFAYYPDPSTNTDLWNETQDVTVADGRFSVLLGSVNPIDESVFATNEVYLGIKVGTDAEMTPRQRVASVAYALKAGTSGSANRLIGYHNDGTVVQGVDGEFVSCQVPVPAGTTSPGEPLIVQSVISIDHNGYADIELRLRVGESGTTADNQILRHTAESGQGTYGRTFSLDRVLVSGTDFVSETSNYVSATIQGTGSSSQYLANCESLIVTRW